MDRLQLAVLPCLLAGLVSVASAQTTRADSLARGVAQLRHAIGEWAVTTRFLRGDGSVGRTAEGSYTFQWVVADRVVAGRSVIPSRDQSSAILFYVSESRGLIEMVSVGADGDLWIMTGPVAGETRTTAPRPMPDGTVMQLRFTRSDVTADAFTSRMEYSTDGGVSWTPGNHQTFRRRH